MTGIIHNIIIIYVAMICCVNSKHYDQEMKTAS